MAKKKKRYKAPAITKDTVFFLSGSRQAIRNITESFIQDIETQRRVPAYDIQGNFELREAMIWPRTPRLALEIFEGYQDTSSPILLWAYRNDEVHQVPHERAKELVRAMHAAEVQSPPASATRSGKAGLLKKVPGLMTGAEFENSKKE